MAKLWIIGTLCLAAFVQVTLARDVAEALNVQLREQLKGYQNFLEADDGTHKENLQKLIELTESALQKETYDDKQAILTTLNQQFTPEFNQYISLKLEEYQVNDDIHNSIEFYNSLIAGHSEFKDEIEKTIATLENILKDTDVKQKEQSYMALDKSFSPEFLTFLKENNLPNVNRELQKTSEFLENLLVEKDVKFETEIKELKTKADAALGDLPVDEKQKALYEVTNPQNRELYEYLQKKFIELN